MNKKKLFALILCVVVALSVPVTVFAHPGRTDEYGGHYDWETGEYHYHHGYPAHQHIDGYCPYDYDDEEPIDEDAPLKDKIRKLYVQYMNKGMTHNEILQYLEAHGYVYGDIGTDGISEQEFENVIASAKSRNTNNVFLSPAFIIENTDYTDYTVLEHAWNIMWFLIGAFFYGLMYYIVGVFFRMVIFYFLQDRGLFNLDNWTDFEFSNKLLTLTCMAVVGVPVSIADMCYDYGLYMVKDWWYAVFTPLRLILQVRLTINIIVKSKKADSENSKNEQECKNPTITAEEVEQSPEKLEETVKKEEQPPEEVVQEEPKQTIKPTRKIYHYHTQSNIMPVDPKHVYWTANGKSFHSNRMCLALRNCTTVSSGTLTKAQRLGHKTPCSVCVGKNYKVKKK